MSGWRLYRTDDAVDAAIDAMSAIYASPPPHLPPNPREVNGHAVRTLRRELAASYAGPQAVQGLALDRIVIGTGVLRRRPVVYCLRRRSAVSTTIRLLLTMASTRPRRLLTSWLTEAEFERIGSAVDRLLLSPVILAEMPGEEALGEWLGTEPLLDPEALMVCDFPVSKPMRLEGLRKPLRILFPSRAPGSEASRRFRR